MELNSRQLWLSGPARRASPIAKQSAPKAEVVQTAIPSQEDGQKGMYILYIENSSMTGEQIYATAKKKTIASW